MNISTVPPNLPHVLFSSFLLRRSSQRFLCVSGTLWSSTMCPWRRPTRTFPSSSGSVLEFRPGSGPDMVSPEVRLCLGFSCRWCRWPFCCFFRPGEGAERLRGQHVSRTGGRRSEDTGSVQTMTQAQLYSPCCVMLMRINLNFNETLLCPPGCYWSTGFPRSTMNMFVFGTTMIQIRMVVCVLVHICL